MIFFEYLLVGLGGSCILIFLAKGVMARLLQRDTSYYDEEEGGCADE